MNNLQIKFLKISFTIAKNIRNKVNTEVGNLYTENHKTLLKEIKDLNKCKGISYSSIRRLNVVKMAITLKLIYRFFTILIKIHAGFFCSNWQGNSKIHMEPHGTQISQK